jgi:hypothetical protein
LDQRLEALAVAGCEDNPTSYWIVASLVHIVFREAAESVGAAKQNSPQWAIS